MFVRKLLIGPTGESTVDPTWLQVESAIRRLDGVSSDEVFLETADPDMYLSIAGEEQGLYTAYVKTGPNRYGKLVDRGRGDQGVAIQFPGGQEVVVPKKELLRLQSVLKAAHTFLEAGQLDSTLEWEMTT